MKKYDYIRYKVYKNTGTKSYLLRGKLQQFLKIIGIQKLQNFIVTLTPYEI